jgi:hypothetical protein
MAYIDDPLVLGLELRIESGLGLELELGYELVMHSSTTQNCIITLTLSLTFWKCKSSVLTGPMVCAIDDTTTIRLGFFCAFIFSLSKEVK